MTNYNEVMPDVTISEKEYRKLLDAKLRYEYLRQLLEDDLFSPPPTTDNKSVIAAFRKTGRYNEKFLKSLDAGLKKSSHFKTA
jgi:hypothetical protein